MTQGAVSYDVRIWDINVYRGKRGSSYRLRWRVGEKAHSRTFATRKLAESFRAGLLHAMRQGEAFDVTQGLPKSQVVTKRLERRWVDLAQEFIDAKWDEFAPRHRKSTVEGLVTLTCALVDDYTKAPDAKTMREALSRWLLNPTARKRVPEAPLNYQDTLRWIAAHSMPLERVGESDGVRVALKAIGTTLDGSRASAATTARKRGALSGALNYAVERKYLPHNPLRDVRTKRQLAATTLDSRVVVNPAQARSLLDAVKVIEPSVHAFFACLYYAALRPAEGRNLRRQDLTLPDSGWGQIVLHSSYQEPGAAWTDDGARGEERHLKHRAVRETRVVPAHPELVRALRDHLESFDTGVGGRLFVTRTGRGGRPIAAPYQNPVSMSTIYRVWAGAREKVLTAEQVASPLAARPYDLRHACVSTWLHAGVDSTQVAAWAGHSVAVLMRVYASSLHGREQAAMERVEAALRSDDAEL